MIISLRKRTPAVAVWTRLVRIHQRMDAASQANFRALGLSAAWFDILARVGAREGLTQGELAASLLVTKGNISQIVSKMVAEGMLERKADGRSQHLFLTPLGREIRGRAVPRQETLLTESLGTLSGAEQTALLRLLRKWEHA